MPAKRVRAAPGGGPAGAALKQRAAGSKHHGVGLASPPLSP